MSTFQLNPRGLSDVVCSLMQDVSVAYQVVPSSIDMNEPARIEMVYAKGKRGGSVRGINYGLVSIKFRVLIKGTSQADAMGNARTFIRAVVNDDGGHIEYKPKGLAAGVMDTYYHYLKSKPPKLVTRGALDESVMSRYVQAGNKDLVTPFTDGILYDVEMMTKAWATSNPEGLTVTPAGPTTIYNHDDGGHDNYVTVLASKIKGDVVFPVIRISPTASGNPNPVTETIIICKKKQLAGTSPNPEIIEAENMTQHGTGAWANVFSAAWSNGEYVSYSGSGPNSYLRYTLGSTGLDSTYLGKVVPFARLATSDGTTTYEVQFWLGVAGRTMGTGVFEFSPGTGDPQLVFGFNELDLPPISLPDYITDDTAPDIDDYLTTLRIEFQMQRTAGAGVLYIDYLGLLCADEFVVLFDDGTMSSGDVTMFQMDNISDTFHVISTATLRLMLSNWEKKGAALSNLVLEKGFDHKIRFLCGGANTIPGIAENVIDATYSVTVKGIHGTVAPFEVGP